MKNILIVTGGSGGHVVPSTSLFEHLKDKFSVKIVSDLRGSKYINTEKFIYELNRLVQAWGPTGYYDKNILNSSLLDLISKINIKYK